MRVEPYTVDSIIHVVKRGSRGMDIVMDKADKWRFAKSLFLLNDTYSSENWHRETSGLAPFERPAHWPERKILTRILAWVLMPNHFHLLLQEKIDGGASKFLQRLCGSMSLCFNVKYESKGSIFQGAYKSMLVDKDSYLKHLLFYIQVKNVLELYPGGLVKALEDFDKAWNWALNYQFSSLPAYVSDIGSQIIDDPEGLISSIHRQIITKKNVHEMLMVYVNSKSEFQADRLSELTFE